MIALIQRVSRASVSVDNATVGEIGAGLLVLLGVEKGDDEQKAQRLTERVLGYRIFGDENDKMNLNVQQAGGSVLVVSQFTLAADTNKGMLALALRQGTFSPPITVTIAASASMPVSAGTRKWSRRLSSWRRGALSRWSVRKKNHHPDFLLCNPRLAKIIPACLFHNS